MIEMEKEDPTNDNYKKGVKYIYKNVPNKIGANFYYFEASNGTGKARDSIIDSPDNGPVLFLNDFQENEIVLIDKDKNEIKWRYPTDKEWIGGVALSDDGKYLAAQSWHHIYLFDTTKSEPLWTYDVGMSSTIGGDVKGGIDISADGGKIFAALGSRALLFNKNSNKPVWEYGTEKEVSGGAYNVAISDDGKYASSAMAGGGESNPSQGGQVEAQDALIFWKTDNKEPLWKYQTTGNFHDVSLSNGGNYLASATGCPDRRAYIFSKDSKEPIMRSEMLTRDSPVDEAKISADGTLAAFGAESGDGAVFLFSKNSKEPLWKFSTTNGSSVRALGLTPSGQYIGAATMFSGDAYIFTKDNNTPVNSWKLKASMGALDIASDGSYIAVGATDNKVHIFAKDKTEQESEFELNEFVGEIDISADNKYIAAGTSGSVYFFESLQIPDKDKVYACEEIIEPEPETTDADISGPVDTKNGLGLPLIISGSIFILALIISAIYLILIKRKILAKNKTVAIILLALIIISLAAALYFILNEKPKDEMDDVDSSSQDQTEGVDKQDDSSSESQPEQAECGNGFCEPDAGETQKNCPQDCTGNVIEKKVE